ncbi:PqiC family protein [Salinisphaera aquimarina]|uniref:Membrane integrity-associated transporter subunit PqiC n=1 Tax=Salinisphaera aquimarina TaxID=2094031 RepID=A0ABV7EL74_9GAMM
MTRFCLTLSCCVLLLTGCAGSGGAPSMFLLDTSAPAVRASHVAAPVLIIDRVTVAPYLDDSGIVYQTEPHRVVMANNNRWASPLATQLTDGLYSALDGSVNNAHIQRPGSNAPASALHLVTRVDQFMGHYDGYAHIAGQWQLVDASGTRLAGRHFEQRLPLQNDGYDALVESLSRGWRMTAESLVPPLSETLATQ